MTYIKIQGILTTLVLLIDVVWVASSPFSLRYNGVELIVFAGLFVLFWSLYFSYKNVIPLPKGVTGVLTALLLLLYTKFTLILCYLAYTTNQPFINEALSALDDALGFHSPSLFYWFQEHPGWNKAFTLIYDTTKPQIILIILYFSFVGNVVYLQRFAMLFMISIPLTIFIGSLWPAVGTYAWYHYASEPFQTRELYHLYELRQNILDIETGDGIVTFPSFHTMLALMFIYTFRHEKKMIFLPVLFLNLLMIFSCLSQGGHYLVDLLGGMVVFVIVVGIEQLIFWKSFRKPNLLLSEK